MPVQVSYPGVYIQERPMGVDAIAGVPTSIVAFVGRAARGRVDTPIRVNDFGEFTREFGPLSEDSTLGLKEAH